MTQGLTSKQLIIFDALVRKANDSQIKLMIDDLLRESEIRVKKLGKELMCLKTGCGQKAEKGQIYCKGHGS